MILHYLEQDPIERLRANLELKQRELTFHTELLIHARIAREELLEAIAGLKPYLNPEGRTKLFVLIRQFQRKLNDEALLTIEAKFDEAHVSLYQQLESFCPSITRNEKRLCAYFKMNHAPADISKISGRSVNSINVGFARLRLKLGLPSNKDLRAFLRGLNQNGPSISQKSFVA